MPTIKKLRTHQILLRDRQVSIRKELIRLERILKQLSDRDEVSVLERMKVMTAELVDTNAQISDITEMIQKKILENGMSLKSRRKHQEIGRD